MATARKTTATETAAPKKRTPRAAAKAAPKSEPKSAASEAPKPRARRPALDPAVVADTVAAVGMDLTRKAKKTVGAASRAGTIGARVGAKVTEQVTKKVWDETVDKIIGPRGAERLRRSVKGKVVVVTGASSGIGEDCAIKLGEAGAIVILAARTPEKLQETLEKIQRAGGRAFAYSCDISDMADCDRFVQTVLENHGKVDILINNAGRSIRRSVKFSFDRFHDFERTMQLNFFGALRLIMGFLPSMMERKTGQIINISSIGVLASPPRFSAYVASKAALDAFSWCAAPEFADSNISFTTINMPLVKTPMIAPTKLYDAFPTLTPDQASDLVMKAVIDKPKRVATGLGIAGAVAQAALPKVSEFVLNQAYRLFPDSAAARGLSEEEARAEQANLPKTPVDLARKLFSQVFSGVHW